MSDYDYTDKDGDRLTIQPSFDPANVFIGIIEKGGLVLGANIAKAVVPTVAAELLKAAGQEGVFIAKAYEEVRADDAGILRCGSGPEYADTTDSANPNWLRNRAANCIALAEYIENKEQRETEAAQKLQERRDALAERFTGNKGAEYEKCFLATKKAIDAYIELEDGK